MFKASLIIGGTGMLADASRWLVARSEQSLIVSRHARAFDAGSAIAVETDWDGADFRTCVEQALTRVPVEAALLWLHDPEPMLEWLVPRLSGARTVLVLGSTHGVPAVPAGAGDITIVRLGRIGTKEKWRWLTHEEIAQGAIAALTDGRSRDVGKLAGRPFPCTR
jgi:hypothetical protein